MSQKKKPLSNAEHQARWRARRAARLRALEQAVAANNISVPTDLRKTAGTPASTSLRKTVSDRPRTRDEEIDDALTQLRQRGDKLVADYVALLTTPPGLNVVGVAVGRMLGGAR